MDIEKVEKLLKTYNKRYRPDGRYLATPEDFKENARRYIKALEEARMLYSIGSVSASKMYRTVKFMEFPRGAVGSLLNFHQLFCLMGYQTVKDSDYFRIHGYGIGSDMVFATNYKIVRSFEYLRLIRKPRAERLAQSYLYRV